MSSSSTESSSIDKFKKMSSLDIRKLAFKMDRQKLRQNLKGSGKFKSALDDGNFWQMKLEKDFPINWHEYTSKILTVHLEKDPDYKKKYKSLLKMHQDGSIGPFYVKLRDKTDKACAETDKEIKKRYRKVHKMTFKLEEPCDCPNQSQKLTDLKEKISAERQKIQSLYAIRQKKVKKIEKKLRKEMSKD